MSLSDRAMMSAARTRARLLVATIAAGAALWGAAGPVGGASPSAMPVVTAEPWIAYNVFGIGLVRADGSDDHRILPQIWGEPGDGGWFEGAAHPDWSPDGARIAFTSNLGSASLPIWSSNVDGPDARELVSCAAPCQLVDHAAWSPDGTKVAFMSYHGPEPDPATPTTGATIEVLDLVTGDRRVVLESFAQGSAAPEFLFWPRWSPDGGSMVLCINRTDDAQSTIVAAAIAIIDADGPPSQAPRVLTEWDMFATYPDWHPTDDLIVFTTHDYANFPDHTGAVNLWTIRPDGTGMTQVTSFGDHDIRAAQPTWTPDGTRIIFAHIRREGPPQIGLVARDATDLHVIPGPNGLHPRLQPLP